MAAGTQLLQFADRKDAPVHALFVDVGNVQDLNERLGHQAGDAALQAVARALSVTFRKTDVLARIGGTQFLVLTLHLEDSTAPPDRPHPRAPRRARHAGLRRCRRRRLLRLDDPPGRRAHLARGPDGPLRLGHAGARDGRQDAFGAPDARVEQPSLAQSGFACSAPYQERIASWLACAVP